MEIPPAADERCRVAGRLLILSDGRPGHVNQAEAFARLTGCSFEIRRVAFRNRFCKALSYLLDRCGVLTASLFRIEGVLPDCCAVVSAGSDTYYANKATARSLGVRSVAIMLPRGYRYNFDLIIAQAHDRPRLRKSLIVLPVNLSCPEPQGLVVKTAGRPCVAMIIGGPSRHFQMDVRRLSEQLNQVFQQFPGANFMVTTSRRTPRDVEKLIESLPFGYRVIYTRTPVNPIADFLAISDYVFVTEDSTSMISEAVSFGRANVELLPLVVTGGRNKVRSMIDNLEQQGYLHRFDGTIGRCQRKFDLRGRLQEVLPCG